MEQAWFLPAAALVYLLAVGATTAAEGRRGATWGVAAVVAFGVGWRLLGPHVPPQHLTSFREWFSEDHLRMLVGEQTQAGPLLHEVVQPVLGLRRALYRDLVAVDLGAAMAAAVVLAVVSARVAAHPAGALLSVAWLLSPLGLVAALSETEAALVALHLGLSVLGATHVAREGATGRGLAGAVACVAWGALAVLARAELVMVYAALIGALVARAGCPWLEPRWRSVVDALGDVARAHPWSALLAAAGWVWLCERALPYPAHLDLSGLGQVAWAVSAADPLNDRVVGLVVVLAALLPTGLVLAFLRGLWECLREPLRHGGVFATLWVLWGAWYLAAHGGRHGYTTLVSAGELVRYVGIAAPLVVTVAARGLAVATPWQRATMLWGLLIPPWPSLVRLLQPAHADRPDSPDLSLAGLWEHDQARQMQMLVATLDAAPDCAVLSRGVPWGPDRERVELRWVAAWPTSGGLRLRVWTGPDVGLDQALELIEGAPCAVAWRSLDCDLVGSNGCAALDGLQPIDVRTWSHKPFLHPAHGGSWPQATAQVGSLRIPGVPAHPDEVER